MHREKVLGPDSSARSTQMHIEEVKEPENTV